MGMELRWRSGVTGNWFVADNWTSGVVPAAGDTAIIASGTAIIAASSDASIIGEAIVLGGAEDGSTVVLHAVNAQFAGSGSSSSELNATLTVSGALAGTTNAVFIAEGNTSFDGQIFVEPVGGSLTIQSISDGVNPGTFTLLNTDSKATIVVSQESFLDFEGQNFVNQGVIEVEGAAEISSGVTFSGSNGFFLLENGGRLNVAGSVSADQSIVFFDGTGKLTIEDAADFQGVIAFAELPNAPGQPPLGIAGGKIDLEDIQAQSLTYVSGVDGKGTLFLYSGSTPGGQPIAQLTIELLSSQLETTSSQLSAADFTLGSDGNGGTLITYTPQGATFLLASLPKPVVGEPGDTVTLSSILANSFGTADTPFEGVWLFPSSKFTNTSTNNGYWTNEDFRYDVTPSWFIGEDPVTKPVFVTDISNVTLSLGNQIDSPPSFQIRLTEATGGPGAEFVTYNIWTVDPAIVQALANEGYSLGSPPTADMIVASAKAYVAVYGDGTIPNTNLCDWIADNVAAGAGATMPFPNADLDPSLNEEGGFWRIVYDSSGPDPVSDWSTLIKPGDIVRMGWFNPENGRISGHSTTVLAVNTDGSVEFYDNNDKQHIGTHDATYWLNTNPTDITIYRIDENQQYLIQGTDLAEVLHGSVYNNLIRPGGGADIITGGNNDTEIQDTAANLDGITVTDFNLGDSFDFIDLNPNRTFASYYGGELHMFENFREVATIDVGKPAAGLTFIVTSDGEGGASVELGTKQQAAEAVIQKVVYWIDTIIDRILDRLTGHANAEPLHLNEIAVSTHDLIGEMTTNVHDFVEDLTQHAMPLLPDHDHPWPQLVSNPATQIANLFHHQDLWS